MEKMTPESLKQAIHRIAGEANAPYTPPHLMQEAKEGDPEKVVQDLMNVLRSASVKTGLVVDICSRLRRERPEKSYVAAQIATKATKAERLLNQARMDLAEALEPKKA